VGGLPEESGLGLLSTGSKRRGGGWRGEGGGNQRGRHTFALHFFTKKSSGKTTMAAQEAPTIDLTPIQRPDLRDDANSEEKEDSGLEKHLSRLLARNEEEAAKRPSFGPFGHLFEGRSCRSGAHPSKAEEEEEEEEEEQVTTKEEKQVLNRRRQILKLRSYQAAFPELLKPILAPHDLEKLSTRELKQLLVDVKFTVACKNTCKVNTWGAEGALALLEGLLQTFTPIRAEGLHMLASDPDFMDIIKEITLDHMDFVYSRPEIRALFLICNKLCTIHFAGPSSLPSPPQPLLKPPSMEQPASTEMLALAQEMDHLPRS
jgi:hypothetical protein